MNKLTKRFALGFTCIMAIGLLAGCGNTDKIGYVDVAKIRMESVKAKQIEQQVADRQAAVMQRLTTAQQKDTPEQFQKDSAQAQEELQIFRMAMSKEFKNAVEASVADVAREKKLTVVIDKSAIPTGGEDITKEVLDKMNVAAQQQQATLDKAKAAAKAAAAKNANTQDSTKKESGK